MDVLYKVLCEIADREGLDPGELEPPLHQELEAETFDAITDVTESRRDALEFTCYGYAVTINGSSNVIVAERPRTTVGTPGDSKGGSPADTTAVIEDRTDALKEAADVLAARSRPLVARLDGLLEVVRKTLELESATLSYVDADTYVFEAVDVAPGVELQAGDTVPLAETACKRVVRTEQALVLRDVESEAPELADTACEVSAYIGVPVFVDGEVYGTFCFFDADARAEDFSRWDLAYVELLSKWVSTELELRHRERALHANTFESAR